MDDAPKKVLDYQSPMADRAHGRTWILAIPLVINFLGVLSLGAYDHFGIVFGASLLMLANAVASIIIGWKFRKQGGISMGAVTLVISLLLFPLLYFCAAASVR